MKAILAIIIAAALGYLLGSLNFSIIIVKIMKGEDIRTMGSQNAGLTNTYRCCGAACALLTLAGDLLKGILAVVLARAFCSLLHAGLNPGNDTHYIGYIAGICAVVGHIFPAYYHFKGGKGVLVGAAALLAVSPKAFIASIAIFAVILAITKYVSLSSLISSVYSPFAVLLMAWTVDGNSAGRSFLYFFFALIMSALIIWMHRTNIDRLLKGTESKFSFKNAGLGK